MTHTTAFNVVTVQDNCIMDDERTGLRGATVSGPDVGQDADEALVAGAVHLFNVLATLGLHFGTQRQTS